MKKGIHKHLKKHKGTYKHIPVAIFLYLAFSYSLFLGLKVNPRYGDAGILITAILGVSYAFFHTRKIRKLETHNPLRKGKK